MRLSFESYIVVSQRFKMIELFKLEETYERIPGVSIEKDGKYSTITQFHCYEALVKIMLLKNLPGINISRIETKKMQKVWSTIITALMVVQIHVKNTQNL